MRFYNALTLRLELELGLPGDQNSNYLSFNRGAEFGHYGTRDGGAGYAPAGGDDRAGPRSGCNAPVVPRQQERIAAVDAA
jgi:hypothetical protein